MSKQYVEGKVVYGASGRRWKFDVDGGYSYSTPVMPLGRPTANKIARIINGSIKRCGTVDGLARSNMNDVFHRAAKLNSRVVSTIGTFCK